MPRSTNACTWLYVGESCEGDKDLDTQTGSFPMRVEHDVFGTGTLYDKSGVDLKIKFDKHDGTKTCTAGARARTHARTHAPRAHVRTGSSLLH